MSDKGSVFQKGGGGTNFEQSVQAAFIAVLAIQGNAPCLPSNEIIEVSFQNTSRGYETDDLLIVARSNYGGHRLLIQIKHDISFTEGNQMFKEVLTAFWKDFNNTTNFDKQKDKLVIVKGGLTKDERNHFKSLFNWANSHATEIDFIQEVDRIKAKKDRLQLIRDQLTDANSGVGLTDKEIWQFLKCMDVLEYDFLQAGSVDKAYFFNLIKLSRSKDCALSEKEIWDGLFSLAATLNKDGGNITTESIRQHEMYKNFHAENLIPQFKAIEKLASDSISILKPLKNTIGGLHLPRLEIREKIIQVLTVCPITIVTGKPGVGKSAQVKDLLQNEFATSTAFTFRADQFNQPQISNVFSNQGIDASVQDIFSCISLVPEKLLFIDSLEKLLEADPECAFKQLIAILSENQNIKLIATSRKFAIDLIIQKFGLDREKLGIVDVDPLNDEELEIVSRKYPQLVSVLRNIKIKPLLLSPKYIDFAVKALSKSADDYSNVEVQYFKARLWNVLIVDEANEKNGLPIKRERAFMEIAINRAKEMKLFTQPIQGDPEAIFTLVKDEILAQEHSNRRYAPSHDIFEDWALVKYISQINEDSHGIVRFFQSIGTEPAIRRAFRLWIEDLLVTDSTKVITLIRQAINAETIEPYWADEILTAVFRSDTSKAFFLGFEKELLENEAKWLLRCFHIIRTCSKENATNANILLPTGSAWQEGLLFVEANISKLSSIRLSILSFLSDWHLRLKFKNSEVQHDESEAARRIVLFYIAELESGIEFWQSTYLENKSESLISILFDLAEIAKDDILKLVERSFSNVEIGSRKAMTFYEKVIKKCLAGVGNHRLINALPDLIIDSAWKDWKLRPELQYPEGSFEAILSRSSFDENECWGIEGKYEFFPSGVYKTPLYALLSYHPLKGLQFLIDFLNYSVDYYVQAKCHYKHKIGQVELNLNDKTKRKVWAAWELWAQYRGLSVTHGLLESLLMSFEKYLLDTASLKTEISRKNLNYVFEFVLNNTNNIAPLGVLASITIAHPEEVNEAILPLFKVREFYDWDQNRALQEFSSLAPIDSKISFAQEERFKSNKLPHRQRYIRGLKDFLLDYQFNVGTLNKEIHLIFDQFKTDIHAREIVWKKTLTEMDIRNQKLGEYDEDLKGFLIQPEYESDVKEFLDSGKEKVASDRKASYHSRQLQDALQNKEPLDYIDWQRCREEYLYKEEMDIIVDRPVTAAVLGLRDYREHLTGDEHKWCIRKINDTLDLIIQDAIRRNFDLNRHYNYMEREIAFSSFHILFESINNDDDRQETLFLMANLLIAPLAEHEFEKIEEYIRDVFAPDFPTEFKVVWLLVVKYSKFSKVELNTHDSHHEKRRGIIEEKKHDFIREHIRSIPGQISVSEIDFETHEPYLLSRALVLIPFATEDVQLREFIDHFVGLAIDDLGRDSRQSYHRRTKQCQMEFKEVLVVKLYLAEILIISKPEYSKAILNKILDACVLNATRLVMPRNGLLEFSIDTLKFAIYKLDKVGAKDPPDLRAQKAIKNFWEIWTYLYDRAKKTGQVHFADQLFLDIEWDKGASHWIPLEGKKEFYHRIVTEFGLYNTQSILNVFATIGEKTLLPDGLSWLVDIYKQEPSQVISLTSNSAEQLVKRLYYGFISYIKGNKSLVEDFIWILDRMVEFGSSEAYFFRENVITYKVVE